VIQMFTSNELAQSSAIHGDFDHASINYSGHQNMMLRSEEKKSRMKKHRVGETFYLVTFQVRDGDSEHYPSNIYPESAKDMSDEELITEEFGQAGDSGDDGLYWVGSSLVSIYDKKSINSKAKEMFQEYGMAAEEDTILAQLYEIEDMEEPSEQDLKNYRNLEIRYGELTRMDAETSEVEMVSCYECGQDYEGDDDFRNCALCDVLLCGSCNRGCEGCSNTVCSSHRCSKDCCDGAFCDECHKEEFGAETSDDVDDGCCFCGADYGRYGNNAQPLFDGRCCNDCNTEMVIPARISMMFGAENHDETMKHPTELIDKLQRMGLKFTGMTIIFTGIAALGGYLIGRNRG